MGNRDKTRRRHTTQEQDRCQEEKRKQKETEEERAQIGSHRIFKEMGREMGETKKKKKKIVVEGRREKETEVGPLSGPTKRLVPTTLEN